MKKNTYSEYFFKFWNYQNRFVINFKRVLWANTASFLCLVYPETLTMTRLATVHSDVTQTPREHALSIR